MDNKQINKQIVSHPKKTKLASFDNVGNTIITCNNVSEHQDCTRIAVNDTTDMKVTK